MTDSLGNYVIENLVPGMYRLQFSIVGYRTYVTPEFRVSSHDYRIDAELEENQVDLKEIEVSHLRSEDRWKVLFPPE